MNKCEVCGAELAPGKIHSVQVDCAANLKAQVATLTAQLAEMTTDRNSEQQLVLKYYEQAVALEAQVAALTTQLDEMTADLDSESRWWELEQENKALAAQVAALEAALLALAKNEGKVCK